MKKLKRLQKLIGEQVSIFADHNLVGRDILKYFKRSKRNKNEGYYIGNKQIPIRAVRSVCFWYNEDSKGLIFVDPKYNLQGAST